VEFVLAQGHFLTATNRYADIVLPITTDWERESTGYIWAGDYMRDALMISDKVVEPYFEAKSDEEAYRLIGEKLGVPRESWGSVPKKQQLFNAVAGTTVICEDGKTWENLCAITEADVEAWGVEGKPIASPWIAVDKIARGVPEGQNDPAGPKIGRNCPLPPSC